MADDLTFMMGKYAARLPGDCLYARNHMWCRRSGDNGDRLRFGFTTYAVRLMQDVYFLDWHVSPGDQLAQLQEIGHIETSKATADLFAPMSGSLVELNRDLLKDPSGINVNCHEEGWLFELAGTTDGLMTADDYGKFLAATWENTQRIIKGKINEDA
jgi:glycine cleavage system H protein